MLVYMKLIEAIKKEPEIIVDLLVLLYIFFMVGIVLGGLLT